MWKTDVKELLDSTDVQDPTDFPPSSTAPGLRALDSALRCNICQELYEAPVVLTCGHCFCSLCARNQISVKPACPSCWKEAAISSFRINPAMEEAVTAWKDARRFVLGMVNEALKAQATASESLRPSKRRKPNSHSVGVISSFASPQRKSGRSDTPSTPKERRNLDVGTSDDDIEQDVFSGSEPLASNSNIECPVCAKSVPMARINDHLDSNCKHYLSSGKTASSSKSGQKDAWSKLLDGKKSGKEKEKADAEPDTPLPKASYTVLKDRQIRDLLAAHDLSTVGDRAQLIARHERWVALYNANLDRSPALRKRSAELRVELRRWEEDRRGSRKEPLKTDIAEYRRANKAEFDKLVQLARPKSDRPSESSSRGEGDDRGESSRRLKGPAVASGDAIMVDSDAEG
ncbi:hypothetical protein DFH94DRAFT_40849 [Russula ochroleuca]|uniref:Postreplication repair E3 ubiquitin-protein ligase RAD18 n=1 Tax=Russula ochroleuca TaxID=152965 RepID=A0A9P5T8P9_9AGAM|nr:hypothetical protein DFH94DRAFT_40849 [Russula ochroleuca]